MFMKQAKNLSAFPLKNQMETTTDGNKLSQRLVWATYVSDYYSVSFNETLMKQHLFNEKSKANQKNL